MAGGVEAAGPLALASSTVDKDLELSTSLGDEFAAQAAVNLALQCLDAHANASAEANDTGVAEFTEEERKERQDLKQNIVSGLADAFAATATGGRRRATGGAPRSGDEGGGRSLRPNTRMVAAELASELASSGESTGAKRRRPTRSSAC